MTQVTFNDLLTKIKAYKKRYYTNKLLKGFILFITLLSSAFLFISVLEYYGRFNSSFRVLLLGSFITLSGIAFVYWLLLPYLSLANINKQISDEEAAAQIGLFFPEIKDKLLNTLQLQTLSIQDSPLIKASLNQKSKELSPFPFRNAINFGENRKYLRYTYLPFAIIVILLLFVPQLLIESTARIINYDKKYTIPAPFNFLIENKELKAFQNDDYNLIVHLNGNDLPENAYINLGSRRFKMKKDSLDEFSYTFQNLQSTENFSIEAAGFFSDNYELKVIKKPALLSFSSELNYPAYLNKKNETIRDIGNMVIPEGTTIFWNFSTRNASGLVLSFDNTKPVSLSSKGESFAYSKRILKSSHYKINLVNPETANTEAIDYSITVIPDLYPTLKVEEYKDSSLYSYVSLGGFISDDYGLERFRLYYKINSEKDNNDKKFSSLAVPFNKASNNQSFFYNWNIDSLNLKSGETLEYYLEVWDNDGVNGSKSSKSQLYTFKIPSEEEIENDIANSSKNTENSIDKALSKSKSLKKEISALQQKLKNKDNLNWQDKKNLEELLKKHEELAKEIEKLKEQNSELNKKEEKFSPSDQETAYKLEQLQKLMDEMLDEETKKLYDELRKLLEKQEPNVDVEDILKKLENKDNTLEKELERTLEMFKQIKLEQNLNEAIKDLKELTEKQEQLSEKTLDKKADAEQLKDEQQQLKEDFKKIEEKLKEMNDINKSLSKENQKELQETSPQENEIKQEMNNSSQSLDKNDKKKSSGSQKKAADKMNQLQKSLSDMQQKMQKQENKENIDDLRDILENLLTLSFDQEALMKDFRKVNQTDPRFVTLSQKQLKLKDDSKMIEDSLLALAKRVFQIQSFVTREVGKMNAAMDESIEAIKDRRPDIASGKQQFAMTSINNLALLLSDVLKEMQNASSSSSTGSSACKKPGKNKSPSSMGELQKALNDRISQLQKGNKSGRQYSEELAKLAAQQEMIRKALKELEDGKNKGSKEGKSPEGGGMGELSKEMEKTETDLVNKRITPETIRRQQDILTRLLEAENATRERDTEEKRESKTAKQLTDKVPPSLEKYLKAKEKEVDLIKTISPSLMPYYKQEVNEYFQKIENKD